MTIFGKRDRIPPNAGTTRDRERLEELFLILSGQPYTLRRRDLLSHAGDLVTGNRLAALLWLWDPDWEVLALNSYWSNATEEGTPEDLIGLLARQVTSSGQQCPSDPAAFLLSKNDQPKLQKWANVYGFDRHEVLLPVRGRMGPSSDLQTIAFLQLLSSDPVSTDAVARLEVLCGGIAVLLSRSRDDRKIEAVERMLIGQAERSADRMA